MEKLATYTLTKEGNLVKGEMDFFDQTFDAEVYVAMVDRLEEAVFEMKKQFVFQQIG